MSPAEIKSRVERWRKPLRYCTWFMFCSAVVIMPVEDEHEHNH